MMTNTSNSIITGARFPTTSRNHGGRIVLNAMMNVSRYRASGPTHKSGIDAMSVVMWKVTPSIRLDGTNASATHLVLRHPVGAGSDGAFGCSAPFGLVF